MDYRLFKIFFIVLVIFTSSVQGQNFGSTDSLSLTYNQAEKLFLDRNFELLASKYQVNEADAAIIQAKLWNNPTLSVDQGAYNPDTKKWFDVSKTGETAVSLDQLIYLGGKRNKRISIEKIHSEIAKYQFYDLIRTLRFQLQTDFYSLYFTRQSIAVYDREITSLRSLIDVYSIQYKNGNIAFKELARLQALMFNLENERIGLLKDASESQSDLIILTGDTLSRPLKPIMDSAYSKNLNTDNIIYSQLIDTGLVRRYDLQEVYAQKQLTATNLALQKALRVPDLTLGANWDRAGSYITNYNSLSMNIDLPFLNRNQGNIKIAQYQIEENKQLISQRELEVKNDISKAYSQLLENDRLFKNASLQFTGDYERLLEGITKGYQNHTISLLEFIDYYETYKDSQIDFLQLQNNRLKAIEELNYAVGTSIIK